MIAVDQDTLRRRYYHGYYSGPQGCYREFRSLGQIIERKDQSEYAVLFFNRNNAGAVTIPVTEAQIASVGGDIATGKTYSVRDLWAHTNLANWTANGTYTTPATSGS